MTTNALTTLTQHNTTNAIQALNAINLDASSNVNRADQSVQTGGNALELTQSGEGSNNKQAANLVIAGYINNASQTVSDVGAVSITHTGANSNNIQALNMAIATGSSGTQVNGLTQSVNAASVSFNIDGGTGNIQAGNYLQANSADDVTQQFIVTGNVTYAGTGTNNLQAGNAVIKETGGASITNLTQTFSANNVNTSYSDSFGSGSIKAANYFSTRL
ncbi:hypothetical protein [Candidatus Thiothrix anitrata]|uniref:Uncharacterized protein n=1 Tax=Candidatus Thiothrix anitrata TaxID=2823902 RepID=A0ABX7X6V4_9GAMM|nr:hypothetical protein [Candidatus Thiothrix anitrata]QTR50528.1 hypothetical protein J8380_02865 [Candidatus Thiothrix anitrata]